MAADSAMAGKFILICGPMCAGKTTELRRLAENHARCELRVLLVRSSGDTRDLDEDTESGRTTPKLFTHRGDWGIDPKLSSYFRTVRAETLEEVEVTSEETLVAIDEGQFFPDLAKCARKWADGGKTVVASALNGKADRTPWPSVSEAVAEMDEPIWVSAICGVCKRPDRKGVFSLRLPGAPEPDADGKAVGGSESYVPACRSCAKLET